MGVGEAVAGDAAPLTQQQLSPVFDEAVRRWSAVLDDAQAVQRLRDVRVQVLDLPGTRLGLASGTVIYIDANAAGHGWFLDPTPGQDGEFAPGGPGSPLVALPGLPAAGKEDLLTTVLHEMGHLAGRADVGESGHADDLMAGAEQRIERRQGELRRPEEDDAQRRVYHLPARVSLRILRTMTSRLMPRR